MGYSILVVDDNRLDVNCLVELMPWEAVQITHVYTAYSGREGLSILKAREIDIVLLDIKMPIMSGLEFLEKARIIHPGLKSIFVSGHEEFSYAKRAIDLEASGYLLKPIEIDELKNVLKKIVSESMNVSPEALPSLTQKPQGLVEEIVDYIKKNISSPLSLSEIAHEFGYSPNYLGTIFHEKTGKSFTAYVTKEKISLAKDLLNDPTIKIYEVAEIIGYQNITYFSRQFKRYENKTPNQYRTELLT